LQYLEKKKDLLLFLVKQYLLMRECQLEGWISFRINNSKKPTKWGMKLYVLEDFTTRYICTVLPHYGKPTTDELERPDSPFSSRIILCITSVSKIMSNYAECCRLSHLCWQILHNCKSGKKMK
jgi:hypothetical protein